MAWRGKRQRSVEAKYVSVPQRAIAGVHGQQSQHLTIERVQNLGNQRNRLLRRLTRASSTIRIVARESR